LVLRLDANANALERAAVKFQDDGLRRNVSAAYGRTLHVMRAVKDTLDNLSAVESEIVAEAAEALEAFRHFA
jgi:hypothetical protein